MPRSREPVFSEDMLGLELPSWDVIENPFAEEGQRSFYGAGARSVGGPGPGRTVQTKKDQACDDADPALGS